MSTIFGGLEAFQSTGIVAVRVLFHQHLQGTIYLALMVFA